MACVLVSAAGYLVDLLLKGHSLAWTLTPAGRELVINQWVDLVANAGGRARAGRAAAPIHRRCAREPYRRASRRPSGHSGAGRSGARRAGRAAAPRGCASMIAPLTDAERKVLALLRDGLVPKQAALELSVTLATIRSHIAAAKRKTGARTIEQLVGIYAQATMPAELQPTTPQTPSRDTGSQTLIERGADLVYLTEELYLRLFILTLLLTVIGCAMSVWFAVIGSNTSLATHERDRGGRARVAVLPCTATPCYRWLRHSRLRQLSPAALAIIAVLCNGPDSASWWVALPLLWVIAAVSSTSLSFTAATVTAGAYLAGTALGGEPLVHNGDAEILGAAVALPGNILIGRLVAEVFARFVLRLHQLERRAETPAPPRPVRVVAGPDIADNPAMPRTAPSGTQKRRRPLAHLTSRELKVLLLVRDGLLQAEIALALGVSTRQVERLLASARSRTGTATTSQLVAKLVTEQLSP